MEKQGEHKTLAEQAAKELIDLIRQGSYGPGDKLPTEAELSERLGVGRIQFGKRCGFWYPEIL